MLELKQTRWVKIHEPGQGNYETKENVMDIAIGAKRCKAEAVFTVRNYKLAAFWMTRYLGAANAQKVVELVETAVNDELLAKPNEDISIETSKWSCRIEKMGDTKAFKIDLTWAPGEKVTKFIPAKKSRRKKQAA